MIVMNVCADACSDRTTELRSWGQFGTNYYLFNESCKWRIQVNQDQVKIFGILYLSFSLKSNVQDNKKDVAVYMNTCLLTMVRAAFEQ